LNYFPHIFRSDRLACIKDQYSQFLPHGRALTEWPQNNVILKGFDFQCFSRRELQSVKPSQTIAIGTSGG